MPPEPTFSRSHLSTFRTSLMAPTTRSQSQKVTSAPSCCHRQLHTTTRSSHWTAAAAAAAAADDDEAPPRSPRSASASCASSPASSPLSSPPASRPPSTTNTAPQNDDHIPPVEQADDGTITPDTIYQHYGRVAQRLFRVLDSEKPEQQQQQQRALDWPLDVHDVLTTTKTLDELPISPNSELPEYQLTQEWFERVVRELREAEEARAAAGGAEVRD
jgi:hypothetical protein